MGITPAIALINHQIAIASIAIYNVDTAFSAYLIYLATRFNIPPKTLGKMIYNIGLEAVIGTVPLVGDIFDAFYKSNMRNLALLEAHIEAAEPELAEAAKTVPEAIMAVDR